MNVLRHPDGMNCNWPCRRRARSRPVHDKRIRTSAIYARQFRWTPSTRVFRPAKKY